ncbi:MAG: hypothetical protein CSH49_16625 [Alcanivorax sp.]|nr:MAG: hypothetical protein CSH49_16625 [Alcanivorax sp.]
MNEQRKASSVKKMISSIIHHVATKVIVSMIIGWIAAVQANQIVPKTKEIALVVMPAVSARTYYKGEIIRSYSLLFRSNAGNPYDDKPQIDKLDLSDEYDGWATRFMASMNECAASPDFS